VSGARVAMNVLTFQAACLGTAWDVVPAALGAQAAAWSVLLPVTVALAARHDGVLLPERAHV